MKLSIDLLKKLIEVAIQSHSDEIGCGECYEQLNRFAELKLQGKSPEEAMPLVKEHLNRCSECQEEYEGLLEALKGLHATP